MAASTLPRSAPETQGITSSSIQAFVKAVETAGLEVHSFMLVRHGKVVSEAWWKPYSADKRHMLFSLSKSFTSTAVGLAVSEGPFSVEDKVVSFFPDDLPKEPSPYLAEMRVKDLLCMATGHDTEPNVYAKHNWAKEFLAHPVEHKPGTHFLYNTAATYMLSAIVQKVTGEDLLTYLAPRLFEPLGIVKPTWQKCPMRICTGGFGLSIRTEDIAKFGQLYLQKGSWEGRQLVPAAWVEEASSKHIDNGPDPENDWNQGYGYQFWRCRYGAYRGDGAFGQYCVVMPEQDTVIAITSGLRDMGQVLNLAWEHLLPALAPGQGKTPSSTESSLKFNLEIASPEGEAVSPRSPSLYSKRFSFEANDRKLESFQIDTEEGGLKFTLTIGGKTNSSAVASGGWRRKGQTAGRFAWTAEDTLTIRVAQIETPFVTTYCFRLVGSTVEFKEEISCGFDNTDRPILVARA